MPVGHANPISCVHEFVSETSQVDARMLSHRTTVCSHTSSWKYISALLTPPHLSFQYPQWTGRTATAAATVKVRWLALHLSMTSCYYTTTLDACCIHMLLRARVIVFSVAHAHISSMRLYYLKKGQTPSLGSSDASIGALIARMAAVCIGNWVVGELMLYGDLTGGSDRWASGDASLFGIMNTWNVDLIDGSELTDCLFQLGRNVSCVNKNLHSPKETGLTETNGKWANGTAYVPWGTTINTPPWNATNRGY